MPRRRPSQKTKSKTHSKPRPINKADNKLKRWDTVADIELDEEDQFHASRDTILLDDDGDTDMDDAEEEVFALRGVSDDSDDDGEEAEYPDDDNHDGMQVDSEPTTSKSKRKSSKATRETKKSTNASDSEEEETWGSSKGAYYSSNAAQLDSEDEEANELEEQEAIRLQAKACEGLCDEDFGLGDVLEGDLEPPEATEQEESLAPPPKKVPQDKHTIVRTLEKECPETLALARDWDDTVQSLVGAKARIDALKNLESETLELGLEHMYYQALLTYATTLAFYLHLRGTDKYAARPTLLRRHPIFSRLLTLKEGINTLESLGVGKEVSDDNDNDDEDDDLDIEAKEDEDEEDTDGDLWSLIKKQGLESDELADLLEDAALSPPPPPLPTKRVPKKKHNTPAAIHGSDRRPSHTFDLIEPTYTRTSRKVQRVPALDTVAAVDPFGEVTALGYHDVSDKQARKKSLRFHVSRIASSSFRRNNARVSAMGGDDDVPYRERRKEREARMEKEKEKRKGKDLLGTGGDDLDDVDPEISKEEKKRKRERGADDEDAEEDPVGYYDLVKRASTAKKAKKKAAYEAASARPELEPENTSGPRSITRAILKNKGLTPHRSKAVRNPRVKKRQKYEQAKKRVASQKAVYKGSIGDVSRYSGEQTGISKVIKSVRL